MCGVWKPVRNDTFIELEDGYGKYTASLGQEEKEGKDLSIQVLTIQQKKWTVHFSRDPIVMVLEDTEHKLRRSEYPGAFFKYIQFPNQIGIEAHIFSLQVNKVPFDVL